MVVDLLTILALVLLNGFLAGAEIAIVSVRKTRLRQLIEAGSTTARAVDDLRVHPERFLATVQIGITVTEAAAGALGGATLAARFVPSIKEIPILAPYADGIALAGVVTVVSYLFLVLGELVPKSLAMRAPEPYALLVGQPLLGISFAAKPAVWFLTASSNLVLRIFGDRTSFREARLSPEEIVQLLDEAGRAGTLDSRASDIATRAIEFAGLTAADVMVPRNRVVALPRTATAEDVRRVFLDRGFARVPIYEETLDNVTGYVAAKDVMASALGASSLSVEELMRPATFMPDSMRAVAVLKEMQKRRARLAIVVDERGGMSGLLTVEDLVEELVGELFSEDERGAPSPIRRRADGTALVLGSVPIREVNRALDIALPEGELWTTIAGYCIALAGRIPEAGERIAADDGTTLEIVESSPRRIRAVRIHKSARESIEPPRAD